MKPTVIEKDFWGEGSLDIPITVTKWVFNWRFPFLHRVRITKHLTEWQKVMNKRWSDTLDLYEQYKTR